MTPRCQCGTKVSATVARVLGDNDNVLPACTNCVQHIRNGHPPTSDAHAARLYRQGRAVKAAETDTSACPMLRADGGDGHGY